MPSITTLPYWYALFTVTLNRLKNPIGSSYRVMLGTGGMDMSFG